MCTFSSLYKMSKLYSWTFKRFSRVLLALLLLSSMLVVPWVVASPAELVLPQINLQRFHVEYDIPRNQHHHQHDRSIQEQTTVYQPIRIAFDTRVLDSLYGRGDTNVDAKIDFIKSTILPQTAQKWAQHLYVQPIVSTVTPIIIGPQVCGGLYSAFLTTNLQYTDADIVIVVGGDPDQICADGTLAYAVPCNIDTTLDRPIAGTFNFCLAKLSSTSLQIGDGMSPLDLLTGTNIPGYYSAYTNTTFYPENLAVSILDVTVHEVAHILGFSDILYPFTRDEFGVPRTARDASNNNAPIPIQRTCGNGTVILGFFPPENVIQVTQPSTSDPNRYEHYFVTERVKAISQIHFNCSTLIGGRLEDIRNDRRQCFGAHWHERLYYGELLSPSVNQGGENVLSLLTLALMEDTGWYKVDYRGAGYPSFGLGAGCEFVTEPCINSTTGELSDAVENEFCNKPLDLDDFGIPSLESLNSVLCDPSHQSWVICDLSDLRIQEPNERTYFPDSTLSTIFFQRADNCPIPSLNLGIDCFDDSVGYAEFYAGESVGPSSRCLNAYTDPTGFGREYRPACIRVTCDLTERVVRIGQSETEQICEFDGQLLEVPGGRTDGATFVCPRLAAVCPSLFTCPDGCFGRGECVYNNVDNNGRTVPTCRCFDTTNTHPSCAPPFIVDLATNSTTLEPTGSPIIFPPFFLPPTATSPATPSPTSATSPALPTMQPVLLPMPSLSPNATAALPTTQPVLLAAPSSSPNETSTTRAPSPTIRRTNAPAVDQPTSASQSFLFSSYCSTFAITVAVTTIMFIWLITDR